MKTTAVQVKPGLEQSRRCLAACRQQAAIHNRAMRELIEHPDEPVASRDGTPAEGLLGRRADWSREEPWIRQVPEPAWQAAIMVAKLRHEAWKRSRGARAAESDERHGRHSRNGHRRTAELFIRQKRQERRNASIYRVLGGVRIHDARRIEIPGIGILETVEKLPVTEHTGSAAVVETKRSRRNGSSRRGWRTWTVRIDHTSAAEAAERAPATEEETPAGSETEAKEADGNAAVTATEEAAAETPAAEVAEAEDDGAANGAGSERGEAVDESLWAYRLVEATTGGASSIDRKGYGTVASARAARKQDGLESITAIARVRRAETDLLQIDGEWVAGATPALDYGVGDERPSLPGARTAAERVEAGAIVAETVPEAWRGLALTDAQGNGVVWTGDTFGPVAGHLYEENGRLVYAWSERATKAWRERTADSALERERDRSALVAVDAGERREWNLPRGTAYLLLEPEVDGSPVRNAVPVLEEEIAQLAAADGAAAGDDGRTVLPARGGIRRRLAEARPRGLHEPRTGTRGRARDGGSSRRRERRTRGRRDGGRRPAERRERARGTQGPGTRGGAPRRRRRVSGARRRRERLRVRRPEARAHRERPRRGRRRRTGGDAGMGVRRARTGAAVAAGA